MNAAVLLFVFLCGLSVGIVWGRHDERTRGARSQGPPSATTATAMAPTPDAPAAAAPVAPPEPAAPVAPVDDAPEPGDEPEVVPAVAAVLKGDLLAPPPKPPPALTKRARKVGLDPATLVPSDDILERLQRADELGVRAEVAQELLGADDPRPPRPEPIDPDLAERERRILERLAQQQPARPPEGGSDAP